MEPYQTRSPTRSAKVGIAVQNGIEKAAKARHAVGFARDPSVDHVEQSGPDDHQARPAELPDGQQRGRPYIDHQTQERQYVRMDLRQGQASYNQQDDLVAG